MRTAGRARRRQVGQHPAPVLDRKLELSPNQEDRPSQPLDLAANFPSRPSSRTVLARRFQDNLRCALAHGPPAGGLEIHDRGAVRKLAADQCVSRARKSQEGIPSGIGQQEGSPSATARQRRSRGRGENNLARRSRNPFPLEQTLTSRVVVTHPTKRNNYAQTFPYGGYRGPGYPCDGSTTEPAREPQCKDPCSEHSEQPPQPGCSCCRG
jgi:hypothetical protein